MKLSIEELAEWMNKQSVTVPYVTIAKKIKELSGMPTVTQEKVGNAMSRCRTVLELQHNTTIVNVRGEGYKIANPEEVALTTAKWVKRTIMYADRTYRLVDIVDRKLIPGALKRVFTDSEGNIRTLSVRGKKFVESFTQYQKQIEKEVSK